MSLISIAILLICMIIALALHFTALWIPSRLYPATPVRPLLIIVLVILVFSAGCMIGTFAFLYKLEGIMRSDGCIIKDYRTCFYFSAVTFTTLGYGDFRPTEKSREIAFIEAFFGYIYLGVAAGTIVYTLLLKRKELP